MLLLHCYHVHNLLLCWRVGICSVEELRRIIITKCIGQHQIAEVYTLYIAELHISFASNCHVYSNDFLQICCIIKIKLSVFIQRKGDKNLYQNIYQNVRKWNINIGWYKKFPRASAGPQTRCVSEMESCCNWLCDLPGLPPPSVYWPILWQIFWVFSGNLGHRYFLNNLIFLFHWISAK